MRQGTGDRGGNEERAGWIGQLVRALLVHGRAVATSLTASSLMNELVTFLCKYPAWN